MASHLVRNLLVVSGVVLLAAQAVLVVCWWKLPQWAPHWTVTQSPFLDPALRAAMAGGGATIGVLEQRLLDWGPAIGFELRHRFGDAASEARLQLMQLASALARRDGIRPGTGFAPGDGIGWSTTEIVALREDLVQLGLAGLADGSGFLPMNAAYLLMPLHDPRVVEPFADFLRGRSTPLDEDLVPVVRLLGSLGDHRAVPALVSVLPIRHKPHPAVEEALDACVGPEALPAVIAATSHPHAVVRQWAVQRHARLPRVPAFDQRVVMLIGDPERQVCLAAIAAAQTATLPGAVPALLAVARQRDDHATRLAAITALGTSGDAQAAEVLLLLADDQEEEVAARARAAAQRLPLDERQQARLRTLVTPAASPPAP